MITCAANGCPSTQTTKIDGNLISFFAFPEDDLWVFSLYCYDLYIDKNLMFSWWIFRRKNQWLHNCNLASGVVNDKEPLHLCELHFEKENFTTSKDLKSSAVPTLFGKIEGLWVQLQASLWKFFIWIITLMFYKIFNKYIRCLIDNIFDNMQRIYNDIYRFVNNVLTKIIFINIFINNSN